jgi:protein-tyrosine phosphatase
VIDVHSHLLPGLDDGSDSLGQSVAVLRNLAREGLEGLILTPHLRASEIEREGEAAIARRDAALEELRAHAPRQVRLYAGFEIMLDQPCSPLVFGDRRLALAGSRYYLVEFPVTVVGDFVTQQLHQIARLGLVPILAHPERYDACSAQAVRAWREVGARMQVDARTLGRPTTRGFRARRLVSEGLADVIAADNHGDRRSLKRAVEYLRQRCGSEEQADHAIRLLTQLNPLAIANDWALEPVPPLPIAERLADRLRRFLFD